MIFSEYITGLKTAEEAKIALEAEQQEETDENGEKKPGSGISKAEKPKSGK